MDEQTFELLKQALQLISDMSPATCEVTLAHQMAQIADEALACVSTGPPYAVTWRNERA